MAYAPFYYVPTQQQRTDLTYGCYNWSLATGQYTQAKFVEALCSTISYIDAGAGERFKANPQTGIEVSHGSIQLHIAVSEGQLQVIAPFVDISTGQKLVMLRKVCELNFATLNLAKMVCKDNQISFLYSCAIEACEPWKIYEILREICWTADKQDDDFVTIHGASRIYKPSIQPFSETRKEQSWQGFKGFVQEALEWTAYWNGAGYLYVSWDVLYLALLRIHHLCNPQGSLKNSLETALNRLLEKREVGELVDEGCRFLHSLDKLPQSAFYSQLYDAATFIPVKVFAAASEVQEVLKPVLTESDSYLAKKDFINAYLCLQKAVYRLFYYYRFNEVQWTHLEMMVLSLNSLSITDGTNQLYQALTEFYSNPRDLAIAPAKPIIEKKPALANWFS